MGVLGFNHNTGNCKRYNNEIMSSFPAATFASYSWSRCSMEKLWHNIDKFSCLQNNRHSRRRRSIPQPTEIPISSDKSLTLNGKVFDGNYWSRDEQCVAAFGYGYKDSTALYSNGDSNYLCEKLYCSYGNSRYSHGIGAPLTGTTCGNGKWCENGRCVRSFNHVKNGMSNVGKEANKLLSLRKQNSKSKSTWSTEPPKSKRSKRLRKKKNDLVTVKKIVQIPAGAQNIKIRFDNWKNCGLEIVDTRRRFLSPVLRRKDYGARRTPRDHFENTIGGSLFTMTVSRNNIKVSATEPTNIPVNIMLKVRRNKKKTGGSITWDYWQA